MMDQVCRPRIHRAFCWLLGIAGLVPLLFLSSQLSPHVWLPLLFFAPLAFVTNSFTFRMSRTVYLSFEMTVCLMATLLFGPLMAAWTAGISVVLSELFIFHRGPKFAARSAGMYILMWLLGGAAYQAVGGAFPLMKLELIDLLRATFLFLVVVVVNRGLMCVDRLLRGLSVRQYLLNTVPRTVWIEMAFMPSGVVMAVVYTRLGLFAFLLLVSVFMLTLLVARQLKRTLETLERRVIALDALTRVGRVIGSSLEMEPLLDSIYRGASQLIDTSTFWIALYDRERNELVYQLLYDDGKPYAPERYPYQPGVGLAAYLIEQREPLLARSLAEIQKLPIQLTTGASGRMTESVLGVPMMVKGKVVGAIAAQSYAPRAFDRQDLKTMLSLANQAAAALENVRLFDEVEQGRYELRAVLDAVDHAMVVTDTEGRVCLANRAMEELLGVSEEKAAGRPLEETVSHDVLRLVAQQIAKGEIKGKVTTQVELSDGRVLVAHVAPVSGPQDELSGYVVAMADVTVLHELSELKSRMIRIASHDLRNPLHLAGGFFGMFLQDLPPLDPDQADMAQRVWKNLDAMRHLIDDLLELERVENGKAGQVELVNMGDVVREALRNQYLYAELKQQQLLSEIEDSLPQVAGNRRMLGEVVTNLLDNAIKYTPSGGTITVRVWTEEAQVLVTVQDTGIGVPQEAQLHIFDRFYRARQPGAEAVAGSGLGLSLVREIAEEYNGRAWVESTGVSGEGSTFGFALPVAMR